MLILLFVIVQDALAIGDRSECEYRRNITVTYNIGRNLVDFEMNITGIDTSSAAKGSDGNIIFVDNNNVNQPWFNWTALGSSDTVFMVVTGNYSIGSGTKVIAMYSGCSGIDHQAGTPSAWSFNQTVTEYVDCITSGAATLEQAGMKSATGTCVISNGCQADNAGDICVTANAKTWRNATSMIVVSNVSHDGKDNYCFNSANWRPNACFENNAGNDGKFALRTVDYSSTQATIFQAGNARSANEESV